MILVKIFFFFLLSGDFAIGDLRYYEGTNERLISDKSVCIPVAHRTESQEDKAAPAIVCRLWLTAVVRGAGMKDSEKERIVRTVRWQELHLDRPVDTCFHFMMQMDKSEKIDDVLDFRSRCVPYEQRQAYYREQDKRIEWFERVSLLTSQRVKSLSGAPQLLP